MSIECALFGTLGRDAERKTSKGGRSGLRLSVRVGDGDAAQWVSVLAFDAEAIAVVDKMVKGARVYLEGRLSLDTWRGSDGADRQGINVMSWHCRLSKIGRNRPKQPSKAEPSRSAASSDSGFYSDPIPF